MGFMSVKKGEKMENRVLVTPTKVCKAKGKCEYVIKFYERALCVCVCEPLISPTLFSHILWVSPSP